MTEKKTAEQNQYPWGRINFVGIAPYFVSISGLLIVASLIILATVKINYGIDFAGGTEIQVLFEKEKVSSQKLREVIASIGYPQVDIQAFSEQNEYLIRFESLHGSSESEVEQKTTKLAQDVSEGLVKSFPNENKEKLIRRIDTVGPTIGSELKKNSLLAGFYSLVILLIYIGLRYDFKYAPSAILCLFHDAIIALALYVVLGKEVNSQTLAAILTIVGYSLNDTVVNYDRIRENSGLHRDNNLRNIMNLSVNEMLSRTIMTSFTTALSTAALWFLAGGVIEDFAFLMLVGIIIGSYSTIYIASPLVLMFERFQHKSA